jgi:hypothetical protein
MYTRRYFLLALTLPLAVVLGGMAVALALAAIPATVIGATTVPYLSFLGVMYFWSTRRPPNVIRKVAYRAPIIFLAFEAGYLVVEYSAGVSLAKDLMGLASLLILVAIYIVLLGYLYTFVMEQGYLSYLNQKRHQPAARSRIHC